MKKALTIYFVLFVSSVFAQDYIVKPDGTKLLGNIISIEKKTLLFKDKNGNLIEYKVDKLAVIHISNPDFKMKDVYFSNTRYEKSDEGIHIEMLDNPIVKSKPSSNSSTTNVNILSEKSSSLSIKTEDDSPKAKIILKCEDCTNKGKLTMESEDKLTNFEWNFDFNEGSAFPMEVELDSEKVYNFKYKDGNKHSIEKKVTIKTGPNIINVFQ